MNAESIAEFGNFIIGSISSLWNQLLGYTALLTGPVLLQLVISIITIWMTLMAGNKHPKAWLIGLANQGLWITLIVWIQAWGLVPLCVTMCFVYYRNHVKWKTEQLIKKINENLTKRFVYSSPAEFPAVGEAGVIYIVRSTGRNYIWVGDDYQVL